jgi:nifR3 family TIM-barrel protein
MAGITDLSFRRIAKGYGADLVTSEMVSAEGLVRRNPSTRFLLQSHTDERPLAIQLFGSEPQAMAEAARMVEDEGADILDLNMGCPVPKIMRQGAGAVLMRDTEKVKRIVEAVRKAVSIPVTVKTRSGWTESQINILEAAKAVESSGADAITVHPRTAKQGFSGTADWSLLTRVKRVVAIPVIGNGDITRPEQAEQMRHMTGCDGVMIGRAAMGNPWIFQQAKQLADGQELLRPSARHRLELMKRHLALYEESREGQASVTYLRSRFMWYSKGLPGSAHLRAQLSSCRQPDTMIKICEAFFEEVEKSADEY